MTECGDAHSKQSLLLKAAVASVADELGEQEAQNLALELTTVHTVEGYVLENTSSSVLFSTASGHAVYSLAAPHTNLDYSNRDTNWLLQVIPIAHYAGVAWRVMQAEYCTSEGWRAVTNRKKKHPSETPTSENRRRSHRRGTRR